MRVPDADTAIVSQDKIVGYLLNPLHPDGAGKAQFFDALGFRADQWTDFADALRTVIARSESTSRVDSAHGVKYIVDGTIDTPSGRIVCIRTVWIIDAGKSAPRLVTAYPHEQGASDAQ
jgi:hypothetical protein